MRKALAAVALLLLSGCGTHITYEFEPDTTPSDNYKPGCGVVILVEKDFDDINRDRLGRFCPEEEAPR